MSGKAFKNEEVPVDARDSSFDGADEAELKLVLHVFGTERCTAEVVRQRPKSDVGAQAVPQAVHHEVGEGDLVVAVLGPALGRREVRCLVIVMPEAIHDLVTDLVKNNNSNTYNYDTTMINTSTIKTIIKTCLPLPLPRTRRRMACW